jgi:hypothetical protein
VAEIGLVEIGAVNFDVGVSGDAEERWDAAGDAQKKSQEFYITIL